MSQRTNKTFRKGRGRGGRAVANSRQSNHIRALVRNEIRSQRVLKYIDFITSGTSSVTAAGTTAALGNIPQGYAQSQRVGDKVEIARIDMTSMVMSMANSDVFSHGRVILYRWRENIGDISPTVALILESPTTNSCFSNLNYENRLLYKIVYDHSFSLVGTSTVPTDKTDHWLRNVRISPTPKALQYRLASSSASTNTICILYISDSAVSPYPVIQWAFRVWYYDS